MRSVLLAAALAMLTCTAAAAEDSELECGEAAICTFTEIVSAMKFSFRTNGSDYAGDFTFNTCGSTADTRLRVLTASNQTLYECDDAFYDTDSCTSCTGHVATHNVNLHVSLNASTYYYVVVEAQFFLDHGFFFSGRDFSLAVGCPQTRTPSTTISTSSPSPSTSAATSSLTSTSDGAGGLTTAPASSSSAAGGGETSVPSSTSAAPSTSTTSTSPSTPPPPTQPSTPPPTPSTPTPPPQQQLTSLELTTSLASMTPQATSPSSATSLASMTTQTPLLSSTPSAPGGENDKATSLRGREIAGIVVGAVVGTALVAVVVVSIWRARRASSQAGDVEAPSTTD